MENINKYLFKICMNGEWNKVIETYMVDKRAHKATITRSGDTAMHAAVCDGQEEVVEQLVNNIINSEQQEALQIQNVRGNTALHFAASMGSVRMCQHIAKVNPSSLICIRNDDGETPLFLAALHGRKQAFLCLHHLYHSRDRNIPINYSNCRRNDGDTILHCAIAGNYFELAFQIIHLYEDLANSKNKDGLSPLHVLASKPSSFGSGSRLGRFERVVYEGLPIKNLEVDPNCEQLCQRTNEDKISYPENYQTFVDMLRVMRKLTNIVTYKFPLKGFLSKMFARKDQIRTRTVDLEATEKIANKPNGAETKSSESEATAWSHPLFPANYSCCLDFFMFVFLVMLVIFGKGSSRLNQIRRKKEKHVWSVQIMNELLKRASMYAYDEYHETKPHPESGDNFRESSASYSSEIFVEGDDAFIPEQHQPSTTKGEAMQQNKGNDNDKVETPILIAAKNGVTEMVEKILELFPLAVHDMDADKKNIVLLAVENRQSHLYEFLLKRNNQNLFMKVDNEGNSALHLAAKLGRYKPWLIPGAALQMHWEIKWYLFVRGSMPPHFFIKYNRKKQTPREIFSETHKDLLKSGGEWLIKTSESCSFVSVLIATVAFATSASIPGGVRSDTGHPTLEEKPAFNVFALSALMALCCAVTAVVVFLSLLTSRQEAQDFGDSLPRKLIVGLTSLFMSIACMLVAFCAGHLFVLKDNLVYAAYPIYGVSLIPVTLFALAQFPLYFDLIWATFRKVPMSGYKTTHL
ncbi:hypothetical protein RIF29_40430 [Crotalaria pallida]|uniref:PGG domain-containing protein n=1 Tax=Crotalaria pallida TaxID=3830 RepID=A0AAN9HUB6_CROPI